jgi:hypothetical protein
VPAAGVEWDYIGYKPLEGGGFLEDGRGNKYIHVNIRTPFSVGERATSVAAADVEVAAALSAIDRFFVVDGFMQAKTPDVPMRVFL